MENENCLNLKRYELSKYSEIVEIACICLGVFLIPLVLPQLLNAIFGSTSVIATHSQYVVGTVVNTLLILAGINVSGWKKIVGIITLPSISAMCSGLIFQTASIYSVYMIPAIWIGNFLIVYLYKYLFVKKNINYIVSSAVAVVSKVAVIFAGFNLLALVNVIPQGSKVFEALKVSMGANQLVTASMGAIVSFAIIKLIDLSKKKKVEAEK